MKNSVTQIATDFINNLADYFFADGKILTIAQMEKDLLPMMKEAAARMANQYIKDVNTGLVNDKKGRKEAGYTIERHGDERRVLTGFGELIFERTYFSHKNEGRAYIVDVLLGIEKYDRLSDGVGVALTQAACEMSYSKSSDYIVDGAVSRQTVMNQVRTYDAAKPQEPQEKRKVSVLHIDADEDHVTLRGGKKAIVPLISVYEGIERKGKRGSCKNIFHISEFGKTTEDLWIQALDEIMTRYDLEDTQVYIHGDGAKWIRQGLEWFPGAIFVLDKYHKNKAIKIMTAGLDKDTRKIFEKEIRSALCNNDVRLFSELSSSLISQVDGREEKIKEAATYLFNNIEAIHICSIDPEANNGGCTEPHVSHILSSRLSTRPMAWSKKTLTQLAPMLANGGDIESKQLKNSRAVERLLRRAARNVKRKPKKIQFAIDPKNIGVIKPISTGKVNQLYRTLNSISQINAF